MSNTYDAAVQLESLMPTAMRVLFDLGESDPLRHLSLSQVRVLRALLAGPKTAGQLCSLLGLSPSSLTQMVGRLAAAGLVTKTCGSEDRRVRTVHLTPEGELLMSQRRDARAAAAEALLANVPTAHPEQLIMLLQEIVSSNAVAAFPSEVAV